VSTPADAAVSSTARKPSNRLTSRSVVSEALDQTVTIDQAPKKAWQLGLIQVPHVELANRMSVASLRWGGAIATDC
jgi:hypothetical protein